MGHDPHSYLTDDPTLASAEMNDIWDDPFLITATHQLHSDSSELLGSTRNITGIYTADELHPSYLHISLFNYTPDILDKLPGSGPSLDTPWEGKGTKEFLEELYSSQKLYNSETDNIEYAPVPELTNSSSASSTGSIPATPKTPTSSTPPASRSSLKRKQRSSSHQTAPVPITFVHDELSMPSNFQANPNNHARFKYHDDGTREYLNAPRKRQKVSPA